MLILLDHFKLPLITGSSEQLIVTSIKHEDGSPPTNIIKKEPVNQSTGASTSSGNSSSTAANDSNNNNDAKDPLSTAMDDKDGVNNDSSLTDECKLPLM